MYDGSDDEEPEHFSEYEQLAEKYQEPDPEPDIEELTPEIPEAPDFTDNDVDESVSMRFWALVLVFNAGLFVTALGVMIATFEGNVEFGGRLAFAGLVILAYGGYQYRKSKRVVQHELQSADDEADGSEDDTPTENTDGAERAPLPRGRMRTVEAEDGTRYLLLKESGESSLLQDPESGETTHLPNDAFEVVDGESPLTTASDAVPDGIRTVLTAAHDDRALGLLLELDARGPVDVRTLTGAYDLCESDLHGLLGEFRAAGLVEEAEAAGERGYDTTEEASAALATLRAS